MEFQFTDFKVRSNTINEMSVHRRMGMIHFDKLHLLYSFTFSQQTLKYSNLPIVHRVIAIRMNSLTF